MGEHMERLNVEVVDGVLVYVAGAQYSVHRLKEHFGKNLCWPVVVSNKRGNYPLTVCPCKGQPGHEPGGHMHVVDKAKKAEFIKRNTEFRLQKGEMGFRENPEPRVTWQAGNAKP